MPVDQKLIDTASSLEAQGKSPAEILDLIKSSKNYADVGGKIDSLRGSMKDEDIYGFLKTAKVQRPVESAKSPGFFSRVNEDLVKRGVAIADELQPSDESFKDAVPHTVQRALRITGNAAGFINDVGGEAIKSAYTTLMPERAQKAVSESFQRAISSPTARPFVEGVSNAVSKYQRENPEAYKNIESTGNIAALAFGSKPVQKAALATEDVAAGAMSKTKDAISKLIRKGEVSPEVLKRIKMYEDANIPWTAADVLESKSLGLVESNLRKNVASADIATKFDKVRADAADRFAREIQQTKFGGKMDKDIAGKAAQEAGWKRLETHRRIKDKMFVDMPMAPDTLIETKNLSSTANALVDEIGPTESGLLSRIKALGKDSMEGMKHEPGTPDASVSMGGNIGKKYFPARGELSQIDESGMKAPTSSWTKRYNDQNFTARPAGTGGIVDATGQPFKGAQTATTTWQQLLSDQSGLRKLANSTKDYNKKRIYNELVDAIDKDIVDFSKNMKTPEIKTKLDAAMNYFKYGDASLPGVKTFRDKDISKMLTTTSPEDIVGKFFRRDNVSDIKRLSAAVGDEGMKPLKQAWVDNIMFYGEEKAFNPAKFSTAFDKMDKPTLQAFLSADEYEGLKKLSEISKHMMKIEKIAGNPSGTAQQVMVANAMAGILHSPIKTVMSWWGSNKFAEKYFNDPSFRNMLVYRLKNRPDIKKVIKDTEAKTGSQLARDAANEGLKGEPGAITPMAAEALYQRKGNMEDFGDMK